MKRILVDAFVSKQSGDQEQCSDRNISILYIVTAAIRLQLPLLTCTLYDTSTSSQAKVDLVRFALSDIGI